MATDHLLAAHAAMREADSGAPEGLVARQLDALDRFSAAGYPTPRHEDWRYTNLRAFRDARLGPAAANDAAPKPLPEALAEVVLALDPASLHIDATALPDGVRALTLRDALAADAPELAQFGAVADQDASAMVHLNDAFAADALLLCVDANTNVGPALCVDWRLSPQTDGLASPRLLVHVGRNASLTLVERREGQGAFTNAVTELVLSDGAALHYVDINAQSAPSQSVALVTANVGRDARLAAYSLTLGGQLNRIDTNVTLAEPGASVTLGGTFLAASGEHVDHHTAIHHVAGHTHSVEDYRGIIGRAGRGVFNGKVIVGVDAQKITSAQSNDNLLLTDSARIDTKPELQIYADDVACSHGATVGRLDEQALFYLRSRGLDERTARRVLMDAFGRKPLAVAPAAMREALGHLLNDALVRLSEDNS